MLNGANGGKNSSLMSEYSILLGEAILRNRARVAEQTAQIETDLMSRVKSEFISNMSHELRTPLNTIIGFSKILREHNSRPLSGDVIVEYANLINDAAGHLLLIINDILDISKMQSGRCTFDAQEINLQNVLMECKQDFEKDAAEAQIRIQSRFDSDTHIVRGDIGKLRQLFGNLIDNAVKFTKAGGTVSIETSRTAAGGSAVLIRNTGTSMSNEEISIALMPFGQVDGSRARWREGTGLGLPIAKALAELHGGRLTISSVEAERTEVTVTLPTGTRICGSRMRPDIGSPTTSRIENTVDFLSARVGKER